VLLKNPFFRPRLAFPTSLFNLSRIRDNSIRSRPLENCPGAGKRDEPIGQMEFNRAFYSPA